MLWTLARRSSIAQHSSIAQSLKNLLPKQLPPSLSNHSGTLYEILSRTPSGGVGKEVHQIRWSGKQINDSFWVITNTRFKCEGKHGKAWGLLYWKGKCVSSQPELIRGGLKYKWLEGRSRALGIKS